MTTNQLKYFITAAETLSFTEAGKLHYISQTAITQHIQSLEEQLGVKLFAREKKRVRLTPAGEIFYMEAKAILERSKIAVNRARNAADGISGSLNIGYVKGQGFSLITPLIKKFYEGETGFYLQHCIWQHGSHQLLLSAYWQRPALCGTSARTPLLPALLDPPL